MAKRNQSQEPAQPDEGAASPVVDDLLATRDTAVGAEDGGQPDVGSGHASDESLAAPSGAEGAGAEPSDMLGNGPDPELAPSASVPALVLHDSVYGKCGEVKEFPADQAAAIAAAGYIDTHPNAIASAV